MAKLSLFDRRRQRVRTSLRARGGQRPRLSIHRSGKHIYAQVIDDTAGRTVASASTIDKDVKGKGIRYSDETIRRKQGKAGAA